MQLTKELFGRMLVIDYWEPGRYFIPLAQKSNGSFIGENEKGQTESWIENFQTGWEFAPQRYYSTGDRFHIEGSEYLLAHAGNGPMLVLVNLRTGQTYNGIFEEASKCRRTPNKISDSAFRKHVGTSFIQLTTRD